MSRDVDSEALFDDLVAAGVLCERSDGSVATTAEFADTLDLYRQTFGDVDDERFPGLVAEVFGLDEATAAERIDELEITREQVVSYLALESELDDRSVAELQTMAGMVAEVAPASPVPDWMAEVTGPEVESFVSGRDAVVFVFKHACDPCDALKAEIRELEFPSGVAVAGIDGPEFPAFLREFEVQVAPTTLCFRDGEHVETVAGEQSAADVRAALAEAYD